MSRTLVWFMVLVCGILSEREGW